MNPPRVVSLVPSITEGLAATCPGSLVGATDWCSHPADLDVVRVRGTKNPDLAAIRALRPDLVVANREENRELDVRRLRAAGIEVWVSRIESVPQALSAYDDLFGRLDVAEPAWLAEVKRRWRHPVPAPRIRVAVPIWRDPWMVIGSRTFAGDLLRRLGCDNVFAEHPERYPRVDPDQIELAGAELVLLPDEPYRFTEADGPEVFGKIRTQLVSGRSLTWYGPSMLEAAELDITGGPVA